MEQFILLLIGDTKTKYVHILRQLEFPVDWHMADIIFFKYYFHGFGTTEMMQREMPVPEASSSAAPEEKPGGWWICNTSASTKELRWTYSWSLLPRLLSLMNKALIHWEISSQNL